MANIFHIERIDNKITLGTTGTTINIASHTASQSLALDASKNLVSVDLGAVYQPLDAVLTDLAALDVVADNEFIVGTGAGVYAHESGDTVRTSLGLAIGTNVQAWDASLDSIAALTYASDSYIKVTAEDTYAIRTLAEVKTDLSLNLVENTALSTWAGTENITTLGTIGTGTWEGTSIGVTYTDAKCTDATADNTAGNETSHADVLVDGDFGSAGLMNTDGAGSYSIKAIGTDVQAYHANLASVAGLTYAAAAFVKMTGANTFALRTIGETADDLEGTIDHDSLANTHDLTTDIDHDTITNGGAHDYAYITGNDVGTDVTAAELEELSDGSETTLHSHAGSGDEKVKIDSEATAGYVGAASNDGVLRTSTPLIYTDGGDYITLSLDAGLTDLATIAMAADKFYYTTADNTHAAASVTAFARTLLDDADAATAKGTLDIEFSATTDEDSEGNAMLEVHAYKAQTDGFVNAELGTTLDGGGLYGYVGTTDDPAGAGTRVAISSQYIPEGTYWLNICFPVAKDEYFEIIADQGTPSIYWKSVGTLAKPIDQD